MPFVNYLMRKSKRVVLIIVVENVVSKTVYNEIKNVLPITYNIGAYSLSNNKKTEISSLLPLSSGACCLYNS